MAQNKIKGQLATAAGEPLFDLLVKTLAENETHLLTAAAEGCVQPIPNGTALRRSGAEGSSMAA